MPDVGTPVFDQAEAKAIALDVFGLAVDEVSALPSYDDQNFKLYCGAKKYVLKISNTEFDTNALAMQNIAMVRLLDAGLPVPLLVPLKGQVPRAGDNASATLGKYKGFDVRCITFMPGTLLAEANQTPALLQSFGATLGRMDQAMLDFEHPAGDVDLDWDLANFTRSFRYLDELGEVHGPERRQTVEHFIHMYDTVCAPALAGLRSTMIHNDANDQNVLVDAAAGTVSGIIDFGDMCFTKTVYNLAIATGYIFLDKEDPVQAAADVLKGYATQSPLTDGELRLLFPLACARMTQSVLMSAHARLVQPDNEYLATTETPAWVALTKMQSLQPEEVYRRFLAVCTPQPHSKL
jgi:Ser/Thr protein kinase RdoA (MazF antagonist)